MNRTHDLPQRIERPPGVREVFVSEVMGSIPVGDLGSFFVPRSSHVDQFPFHFLDKIGTAVNFHHIQTTNAHGTGRDGTGRALFYRVSY